MSVYFGFAVRTKRNSVKFMSALKARAAAALRIRLQAVDVVHLRKRLGQRCGARLALRPTRHSGLVCEELLLLTA